MLLEDVPPEILDRFMLGDEPLTSEEALWRLDKLIELKIKNVLPYMMTYMKIENSGLHAILNQQANEQQLFMLKLISSPTNIIQFIDAI